MRNIKLVLALLVSLGVAACGGGGDSGVGNSRTPLYIDSTNVQSATSTAVKTAIGTTFEVFNPSNFATDIYDALSPLVAKNIPCTNNGGNVAADLTTPTGTLIYSNCVISATTGKTLNGTVYVYNALLDTNIDRVTATLSFNNLKITLGGTTNLTGSYDLTADGLNNNIFIPKYRAKETILPNNIFPEKLILTNSAGQQEALSNFNFHVDVISNSTTTYTSNFNLASDSLGGSITHQNIAGFPYEKSSPNLKPNLGKAYIFGQNPTELRVTVFGNENSLPVASQVKVDRSIDSGFSYSFTSDYSWSQL